VMAAAAFLRLRYPSLFFQISQAALEVFLARDCRLVGGPDGSHGQGNALYQRGQASKFASLVITGEVKVFSGNEAYESIHGPWSLLGKRCLDVCLERTGGGMSLTPAAAQSLYKPDFTAVTAEEKDGISGTRLLLITIEAYSRLLSGKPSHFFQIHL
ncbi:unnamed protein product, partial [Polarella glacialis]